MLTRSGKPIREQLRHVYLRHVIVPGLRLSGPRLTDRLATRVGRGLFRLGAPAGQVAMSRACRALGDSRTNSEIARIVEASFEHAARFWGESLFLRRRLDVRRWRDVVSVRDAEGVIDNEIERLRLTGGREHGAIFTSAYLGNPAVAAVALGRMLGKIHVIADFENQPLMRAWANDLRAMSCIHVVERARAAVEVPAILDAGGAVFIIGEHARHGGKGVQVRWLGREIQAYRTIGLLSVTHGAPVIPLACTRFVNAFQFSIAFDRAVDAKACDDDPDRIVRATLASFERFVMESPEQYLWAMPDDAAAATEEAV